jgi:hypothetical protein
MSAPARLYESLDEMEAVVLGFESCRLAPSEFTHTAHLTVALWYLSGLTVAQAAERMRTGLYRFLDHHGLGHEKYNQTITLFWLKITNRALDAAGINRPLVEIANEVIARFGNSQLIFDYYSRERIFSEEAKREWVEPDLKPLDF